MITKPFPLLVLSVFAFISLSCATVKDWTGMDGKKKDAVTAPVVEESPPAATEEGTEATLRNAVHAYIAETGSADDTADAKLIRRKPYFYKELSYYPGGTDGFTIDFREAESRMAPFAAEVNLDKVRYSTKLHRDRQEAIADNNYFRDTGNETLSYEWRGGRWARVGSLFVADTTEELVAGEWQPVNTVEVERLAEPDEQDQGFIGRTWSWITGR